MIAVTEHPEGAVVAVRARAAAKENALIEERDGALLVAVTAPPEHGKANEALVEVLADGLNLHRSQIQLIAGATSKIKKFLVRGVRVEDLTGRIEAALTPTLFDSQDPRI